MASASSSSASSSSNAPTPTTAHFDLDALIKKIDDVLSQKSCPQKNSGGKTFTFSDMIQPASADISKFLEGLSQGAKTISDKSKLMSNLSAEAGREAVVILKQMGDLHWVAAGFVVLASVLERFEKISSNQEQCWDVLKRLNDLAKCLKELKDRCGSDDAVEKKADETISYIVQGAIMCLTQIHMKKRYKFFLATKIREDLIKLDRDISHFHVNLILFLATRNQVSVPTEFSPSSTVVGIKDQVEKITEYLDLQSDEPAVAVVVYGIGGIGKTTITDTVFHGVRDYKTCMISLQENVDGNSVETLQADILEALTGIKYQINNYKTGQHEIHKALLSTKEPVLLYIDNVLRKEYVKEILPERIYSPEKFRLILTARKKDVVTTLESFGIRICKVYDIKPLLKEYSIDYICSKLGANSGCNKMKISQIAEKCSGIPLVMETVGGYLSRAMKNEDMELDQTLDRVLQGLDKGEPFSCNTKDMEYESKLMFAYDDLTPPAQDAFLDISIFFCGWNWDTVRWIVGEEELRALEEGALVKRIDDKANVHDVLVGISRKKSENVRITSRDQLSSALQNPEITGKIKGIWLDHKRILYSDLSADLLDKMHGSLRILALGEWTMIEGICTENFKNLKFLQAGDVANLPFDISMLDHLRFLDNGSGQHIGFNTASQAKIPEKLRVLRLRERLYSEKLEISPDLLANLKNVRSLKLQEFANLFELPGELKQLKNLVELDLSWCANLFELPKRLGDLKALQELNLDDCKGLTQLPESMGELQGLKKLNLRGCRNLKQLPDELKQLTNLVELDLSYCESLFELPKRLGDLKALQELNLTSCEGLTQLPESIEELKCLKILDLGYCKNVKQLPESFGSLSSLEELDLNSCEGIYGLPSSFDQLTSLRILKLLHCNNLSHLPDNLGNLTSLVRLSISCDNLSHLPDSLGNLTSLVDMTICCPRVLRLPSSIGKLKSLSNYLTMDRCHQLQDLPEEFCDLNLERLKLDDFLKLERLPDRFMEFTSLKSLSLRSCKSLERLPAGFGKLPVLEDLELESCIKLQELSSDFHCLSSLKKLILSRCEVLDGLWMETVVNVSSLNFVDITGSCRLEDRWMELREAKDWEIFVKTDKEDGDEDGRILKKAASLFFNDECSLFDCHGTPFNPSALAPNTTLVLVFESSWDISEDKWKQLMENIQGLLEDCIDPQIIHVMRGRPVSDASIQERMGKLNGTTLGLPCGYSKVRVAFEKLVSKVIGSNYRVEYTNYFVITTVVDKDGTKQFSEWKEMTNFRHESKSVSENYLRLKRLQEVPQERNTEILRSLLVTEGKDFLLLGNSKQVNINSLQGKVVLLLVSKIKISPSDVLALREMYTTASDKHKFEIVWMPIYMKYRDGSWGSFVRTVESMPWPAMRNPWSIDPAALKVVRQDWKFGWRSMVVVVDEKGGVICNKNVKSIVERWGMEAYPFSTDQIHKLRMAQWDQIKAKSTLEVLFENFGCFGQVKESMVQGRLICLYGGGDADGVQISDFTSKLTTFAASDAVQVIYVGREHYWWNYNLEEAMHERNRQRMPWLSLSFVEAWKLWNQIEYLLEELEEAEGYPEDLEKYKASLGIFAGKNKYNRGLENTRYKEGVWMMVVDESGEVARGCKVEEVVGNLLKWTDEQGREIAMQAISRGEVEHSSDE